MSALALLSRATAERSMMGGRVSVHALDADDRRPLQAAADGVIDRIGTWAARLTRYDAASELSRLNADPGDRVAIGPTLTAVLDWARGAETMTDGIVDVAMLDARLAAEAGTGIERPVPAGRRWSLERNARGAVVRREPGVLLDIDGVAKGWLADRALAIMAGRSALVDADGDIAARVAPGDEFLVGVADPGAPDTNLAVLRLAGTDGPGPDRPRYLGVATSGTSIHRWTHGPEAAHHLIDPATWLPARTDVVQATVLAESGRLAEAFAKVAVIAGADRAPQLCARAGVLGLLLLTTRGEVRATPEMLPWLV